MRSNRGAVGWAKKAAGAVGGGTGGGPGGLGTAVSGLGFDNGVPSSRARRTIVYVIGGFTHRCAARARHPITIAMSWLYLRRGPCAHLHEHALGSLEGFSSAWLCVLFGLGSLMLKECGRCSELRAAHKMSAKLKQDIIIGGTSLDTPSEFLEHLKVWLESFRTQDSCVHARLLRSLDLHLYYSLTGV